MAARNPAELAHPGDILLVTHDFSARSLDELSLSRGDKIELIERDDDFGDGWFLGKHQQNGNTGLFPAVYTTLAPRATLTSLPRPHPIAPITVSAPALLSDDSSVMSPSSAYPISPAELQALNRQGDSITSSITTADSTDHLPSMASGPLQHTVPSSSPSASNRSSLSATVPRSMSMSLAVDQSQNSPVMTETLSVIDEHITDMHTPRHSLVVNDRRGVNDSASEYSNNLDPRLSYINGRETDEEEQGMHTEEEVLSWSPTRVAEYLEDVGADKKHCQIFLEQEISGEVLLGMDQATILLKEFELGPVGPRLKTWNKIKALQQEVKHSSRNSQAHASPYSTPDNSTTDVTRTRSTSVGTVLPRIPSLMESPSSRSSRQTVNRASSQLQQSISKSDMASPLSNVTSAAGSPPRPSAASIRSLNHSRRHSSIDFAVNPPSPHTSEQPKVAASQNSHKKQSSFDRGWTMSGQMLQAPQEPLLRPSSSTTHMHSISSGGTQFDGPTREIGMTVVSPSELDRGYFSGNELDNRKSRNVLRKKDSPAHSRTTSYSSETARRASAAQRRHSRVGSTDSMREYVSPILSPAMRAYYGMTGKTARAASGPEPAKPLPSTSNLSPTVTKLDYNNNNNNNAPSIDAVANSPALPESETSSTHGRASPSTSHTHSFFSKKLRSSGLRAISDAVTGNEKALVSSPVDMTASPVKESPIQSPSRTNSSTPSGTSKSFELENTDAAKQSSGGPATIAAALTAPRRKTKKNTSAYIRGLEQKTPQEQIVGCDYSGWMKKKSSNLMTTWKTRLFVLRGRRLSYYYSEFDTEEKGLIDISSHRVLPANDERITGLHATLTGATSSPSSPQNASIPTAASTEAAASGAAAVTAKDGKNDASGMFIFKLVPPRSGLSKAVNFTKPTVHYFAVDNIQQGRLWMAALMKATIDRDENVPVVSTYQQKTISLLKARAMRQRPPALMGDDDEDDKADDERPIEDGESVGTDTKGLAISGLEGDKELEVVVADVEKGRISVDGSSGRTGTLSASISGSLKGSLKGVSETSEVREISPP